MATTYTPHGNVVDHSKVVPTKASEPTKASAEPAKVTKPAKPTKASEPTKVTKAKPAKVTKAKPAKGEGEFDHSPKTTEELAQQDAEREAIAKSTPGKLPKDLGIAKAKKKVKKEPGSDKRVITLVVKENPKREGCAAHTRFALYKTGMTVEEFVKAGGTMGDVNWDVKHKFIELK